MLSKITVLIGLILILAVLSLAVLADSMTKEVEHDEHMYCIGGALLADGKMIYRDFSYVAQMPYHALVYAALFKTLNTRWFLLVGRMVSAVCDILLAGCILGISLHIFKPLTVVGLLVGVGAVILWIFNPLVDYANGFAWNHDVVIFLVMVSLWLRRRATPRTARRGRPGRRRRPGGHVAPPEAPEDGVGVRLALRDVGWSKGLSRSQAPHSAVATSHSKNAAPRPDRGSNGSASAGGRPSRRRDQRALLRPRCVARRAQRHEQPVGAVRRRLAHGLAHDRQHPRATLPGALRDELLHPRPERFPRPAASGASACRAPAPPRSPAAPRGAPPAGPPDRPASRHSSLECCAPARTRRTSTPEERRGHEPEERERREAPADVGRVEEDVAEPGRGSELRER